MSDLRDKGPMLFERTDFGPGWGSGWIYPDGWSPEEICRARAVAAIRGRAVGLPLVAGREFELIADEMERGRIILDPAPRDEEIMVEKES